MTQRSRPVLATLTHARLRAAQGDRSGACRVLRSLLSAGAPAPQALEARRLLERLSRGPDSRRATVTSDQPAAPARASAQQLATSFRRALGGKGDPPGGSRRERIHRLRRWLERVESGGPAPPHRL